MEGKSHSISIVGTGLIGASLGKALSGKFFVKGYDKNSEALQKAFEIGAVHRPCKSFSEVFNADIIVLSIPVQFIPTFLKENRENFKKGSIVTDTGSTKSKVIEAMRTLPEGVAFIGGHPIAGKEKSGPEYADKNLFCGKKFVLTKENNLTEKDKKLILEMVYETGALPVFMEAKLHDRILAYTSHFPYLISSALFKLALDKEAEIPNIFDFAGSGLRDTTRIASGDPVMSVGMLETNSENIESITEEYIRVLSGMLANLKRGELSEELKRIKERRDKIWK